MSRNNQIGDRQSHRRRSTRLSLGRVYPSHKSYLSSPSSLTPLAKGPNLPSEPAINCFRAGRCSGITERNVIGPVQIVVVIVPSVVAVVHATNRFTIVVHTPRGLAVIHSPI